MIQETSYSLLHHNTFGLSARCRRFWEYTTVSELQDALAAVHHASEGGFLHIGSGSILLFTKDFDGTILHSAIRAIATTSQCGTTVIVRAGGGVVWDDFVAYCVDHGYYGLENLSAIPGEVGASAVQNIGAYGSEACDFINEVTAIELATGKLRTFRPEDCHYAYRQSIFKNELRRQYAVTSVSFRLSSVFQPNLSYSALLHTLEAHRIAPSQLTAERLRQLICDVRAAKLPDPKFIGNAGSFFINPVVDRKKFETLLSCYPGMPHYDLGDGVKIPAGWLIEQCGWRGRRRGNVGVYDKQALVLVNYGGAEGRDIVGLSDTIRADVSAKFGIDIHPEVNFI